MSDQEFSPGWSDYRVRLRYQAYDVGAWLKPGPNEIRAVVAEGWCAGCLGWLGRRQYRDGPLAFVCRLEWDGGQLVTDGMFAVGEGPIRSADLMMGTVVDQLWDAGPPVPATVLPGPKADLTAASGPPVRPQEWIAARSVTTLEPGVFLAGRLPVRGDPRTFRAARARRGPHAGNPHRGKAGGNLSGQRAASLNRIAQNVDWGLRGNIVGLPTDCPQRDERPGWTGDIQVFAPTACWTRDMMAFLSEWLQELDQDEAGRIGNVAFRVLKGSPAWGDAVVLVPWTLYRFYGDASVLRDHVGRMEHWIRYLNGRSQDGFAPADGPLIVRRAATGRRHPGQGTPGRS